MPLTTYSLVHSTVEGPAITADLFGVNQLFSANSLGPGETFTAAYDLVGASGVRFPGGSVTERYFDITDPDRDHVGDVPLVPLSTFMQWCELNRVAPTIVIPTAGLFDPATGAVDPARLADVAAFVAHVVRDYPGVEVSAFEIGNEYWGSYTNLTSAQYGIVVDAVAPVIQGVLDAQVAPGTDQPHILAQLGAPWGPDFDQAGYAELSWSEKIARANHDIVDQLGTDARAALDGVIDHYFMGNGSGLDTGTEFDWNDPGAAPRAYLDATNFISEKLAIWRAAGLDLPLNLTEWGSSSTLINQLGLRGASVLIEQFDMMLGLGAESAYAWPLQLNTNVDLAGSQNTTPYLSPIGAAFRLMSEVLTGLHHIDTGISGGPVEVNGYAGDDAFVFFVMSRSDQAQTFTLDLSAYVQAFDSLEGVRLVIEDGSANGRHWVNGSFVDTPIYTEHDVHAQIVGLDSGILAGGALLDLTLAPYEVIRLVYDLPDPVVPTPPVPVYNLPISGGAGSDEIHGNGGNDTIRGMGGFDVIYGGGGLDTLYGNAGNDRLYGDDDDDLLYGGVGADELYGGNGNDRLDGNDGFDLIHGGEGDDVINGNAGWDRIFGGAGADTLYGGIGADQIDGDDGDDTIYGGGGADTLRGGAGNDTIYGNGGNDILHGGAGDDVLYGGIGADTFIFRAGDGNDRIMDLGLVDHIQIGLDLGVTSIEELWQHATVVDRTVVLDFGDDSLTIANTGNLAFVMQHIELV